MYIQMLVSVGFYESRTRGKLVLWLKSYPFHVKSCVLIADVILPCGMLHCAHSEPPARVVPFWQFMYSVIQATYARCLPLPQNLLQHTCVFKC